MVRYSSSMSSSMRHDRHGLALAVCGPPCPAGADQVGVLGTPSVPGGGDHEPRPTAAAVDAATQVVLVGPLVGPGGVVRREDVLHRLPGLGVHERLVQPRVGRSSPVVNLTLVVGVAEELVEGGHVRRGTCQAR